MGLHSVRKLLASYDKLRLINWCKLIWHSVRTKEYIYIYGLRMIDKFQGALSRYEQQAAHGSGPVVRHVRANPPRLCEVLATRASTQNSEFGEQQVLQTHRQ